MSVRLLVALVLLAGCVSPVAQLDPATVDAQACVAPCRFLLDETGSGWEPHVAVDPRDPLHVVAATRPLGFGPYPASFMLWFDVHVTRDGGASWNVTHLRYTDPLAGSADPTRPNAVGDPVLAFLPDGTLLMTGATLQYLVAPGGGTILDVRLFVARSADGGATFDAPVVVARSQGPALVVGGPPPFPAVEAFVEMPDKPWLATGPDGTALLTWTRFSGVYVQGAGGRGDIVFSASTDGGRTWSAPGVVAGGDFQGSFPVLAPDGAWHVAFVDLEGQQTHVSTSRDRGATWKDQVVAPGDWMPSLAVAPDGRLLLAASAPAPALLRSDDGGRSWSAPLALDQPETPGRTLPSVVVDGEGVAYVTFAHAVSDAASEFRAVVLQPDGARHDLTLDAGIAGPTDRLGDYLGLAAAPSSGAFAVWTTTADGSKYDVVGAWVPAPWQARLHMGGPATRADQLPPPAPFA